MVLEVVLRRLGVEGRVLLLMLLKLLRGKVKGVALRRSHLLALRNEGVRRRH
jgi:hypothetical protein